MDTKSYVLPRSVSSSMVPTSSRRTPWCSTFLPAAGVRCTCPLTESCAVNSGSTTALPPSPALVLAGGRADGPEANSTSIVHAGPSSEPSTPAYADMERAAVASVHRRARRHPTQRSPTAQSLLRSCAASLDWPRSRCGALCATEERSNPRRQQTRVFFPPWDVAFRGNLRSQTPRAQTPHACDDSPFSDGADEGDDHSAGGG